MASEIQVRFRAGAIFSHTHISLLFSAKTSCLQSPIRRRHPHLSDLPCPLPMVCTSRSHRGLALRTRLYHLLGMPRRVYHPRRPYSLPYLLRREHTRCPRHERLTVEMCRFRRNISEKMLADRSRDNAPINIANLPEGFNEAWRLWRLGEEGNREEASYQALITALEKE